MPQCKAKAKGTGEQCRRQAMHGTNVCYMHGGKSLKGMESGRFKTGRYSKHLPARLSERYIESRNDPDLLALRDEVAIVDSRLNDLIARVDTGEAGRLWGQAQAAFRRFRAADATGNTSKRYEALDALSDALSDGVDDYLAWEEIQNLLEQRRKLVETERKRLIDMQQMISTEQAMLLISAITDSVRRHVNDRSVLANISADIGGLLNRPGA